MHRNLISILGAVGVLYGTQGRQIEIFPGLSPYDERTLARPYNPGPKIIHAPIPDAVYEHKRLNLPDPTCLAGCVKRKF